MVGSIEKFPLEFIDNTWCWSVDCTSISSWCFIFFCLLIQLFIFLKVSKLSDLLGGTLHFVHRSPYIVILITIIILSEITTQFINNLSIGLLEKFFRFECLFLCLFCSKYSISDNKYIGEYRRRNSIENSIDYLVCKYTNTSSSIDYPIDNGSVVIISFADLWVFERELFFYCLFDE